MHGGLAPSPWVTRWSHLIAPGGTVLDVACGHGRHMQWLSGRGFRVTGVDRADDALQSASAFGTTVQADIEDGAWPFPGLLFDAVVVTNYLWRPRMADIRAAVAPGGVLLYETFAAGNETVGKPSRADFLLRQGELIDVCRGWHVVAFEDGYLDAPARFVQRIAAVRPAAPAPLAPARHPLLGIPASQ